MQVGLPGIFEDDTDDDPNNAIDECWEYAGVMMNLPSPGADGYIP